MYSYSDIRHVHLEISTRCNAACPGCPRNLRGVDVIDGYPLHDMTLIEAQRIFPPEFLQQLDAILINGNLGDFVTAQDGLKIVQYFRQQNPKLKITISTNASARPGIWPELAKLDVNVLFCIDGLKHTHELYRRQTNWDTIINHAQSFILHGGTATWKMIVFDHNQHEIEQCRQLSQQLGFKFFQLKDDGRNKFPVFDQKKNYLYSIGDSPESAADFEQIHNAYLDSKTNGYIEPVEKSSIQCSAKTNKSVYITATGEVYPCCWLGFYPRTMWMMGNSQTVPLLDHNNANHTSIQSAIQWFDRIETTWKTDPLVLCSINCGVKIDDQSQCDRSLSNSLQ